MNFATNVQYQICRMRSIAEWLERLIANAKVVTVMGSIPKSSDTVESEEAVIEYKEV